jgi:predicted phosphate transport protein (TIGR00153 family)
MKFSLIPREEAFFPLFEESACNVVKAAEAMKDLVYNWSDIEKKIEVITELEHEGDTITHKIIAQLHRSFITPFDREDIAGLANTLDDVIDFIHAAADAMIIYRVEVPGDRVKELADIIYQGALEIEKAMPQLRRHSDLPKILDRCVELNRLENMADRVYRTALAEIFTGSTDIVRVIQWREIYEYLETATDRCEDVANVLEGVALKNG